MGNSKEFECLLVVQDVSVIKQDFLFTSMYSRFQMKTQATSMAAPDVTNFTDKSLRERFRRAGERKRRDNITIWKWKYVVSWTPKPLGEVKESLSVNVSLDVVWFTFHGPITSIFKKYFNLTLTIYIYGLTNYWS